MSSQIRIHAVAALLIVAQPFAPAVRAQDRPNVAQPAALTAKEEQHLSALHERIDELRAAGQHAEALASAEEYVALLERAEGPNHSMTISYRHIVDNLRKTASMPAEARSELAEAFAIEKLAEDLMLQGDYLEAEPLLRKQWRIRKRLLGAHNRDTYRASNDLGMSLLYQTRFAEAEPLFRETLAGRRGLLGDAHFETLRTMACLGLVRMNLGDYAEAEPLLRECLDSGLRVLGEDHEYIITYLDNMGSVLMMQGRYFEAEEMYRKAVEAGRRGSEREYGRALTNLGMCLALRGETMEAEDTLRQALEVLRRQIGPDHPDTLVCMDHLGRVLLQRPGNEAEATALHREALQGLRTRMGEDHFATLTAMTSFAYLLKMQGDFQEAENLLTEVLHRTKGQFGPDQPEMWAAHENLARVLIDQGKLDDAQRLLQDALEGHLRLLGAEHPFTLATMCQLGNLYQMQEQLGHAADVWAQASASYEAARLTASANPLGRVGFSNYMSPGLAHAVCLAAGGRANAAWRQLESYLARGLLDAVSARHTRPLTPTERDREAELIKRITRLDEVLSTLRRAADSQTAEVERLRGQRGDLQAHLLSFEKELQKKYGPVAGQTYTLEEVQSHLPRDAALLAWIDLEAAMGAVGPEGDHWACVVRHEGPPTWVDLAGSGPAGAWTPEDRALGQSVRALLTQPAAKRDLLDRQARGLFEQRLAPLLAHLEGVRHLVVVAAGPLAGLPVEVLAPQYIVSYAPSGTMYAWLNQSAAGAVGGAPALLALGDPLYLPSEPAGSHVAEATVRSLPDYGVVLTAVMPDSNAQRSGIELGDVLQRYGEMTIGNPDELRVAIQMYGAVDESVGTEPIPVKVWRSGRELELPVAPGRMGVMVSPMPLEVIRQQAAGKDAAPARGGHFAALPGTRTEVTALARIFRAGRETVPDPMILTGRDASERRLQALAESGQLRGFRFLHLATHAHMDDEVAMRSALILSQASVAGDVSASPAGEPVYDGRLTAEQIVLTWKLDAELVTLSACETALGKSARGEGFLGFAQALFVAGARSLVLSLWKVDDTATTLLMARFYENLLGRYDESRGTFAAGEPMTKAAALHEARRWLRELSEFEARRVCRELRIEDTRLLRGGPQLTPGKPVASSPDATEQRPFAHPYYWAAFILIGDAK